METWKMLLLALVLAVVLGCIAGIAIGKYAVKKARSNRKPLLSVKQRLVYTGLILAGAGLIVFANLYPFSSDNAQQPDTEAQMLEEAEQAAGGGAVGGRVHVRGNTAVFVG